MSEKIIFNFFDDSIEDNIQKLVDYFRLEKDKVIEYISSFDNPADITVENFIVKFGINLTNFDCANVDIVCRHMTVLTKEGLEDVKTKGLLDLVGVLTEDTVFAEIMTQYKYLGLPSFESVSRTRRKLQAKHPELSGNARMQRLRATGENAYRKYAKE